MNKEPLKGKIAYATAVFSEDIAKDYAKKNKKKGLIMSQVFMKDWIEEATEWLKEEIKILSPKHKPKIKYKRNCYCKACVKIREIEEKIDQAFPDLYPKK